MMKTILRKERWIERYLRKDSDMIGDQEVEIVHNRSRVFFCSCNAYELPRDKELSEQQLKPGDFLSLEMIPH